VLARPGEGGVTSPLPVALRGWRRLNSSSTVAVEGKGGSEQRCLQRFGCRVPTGSSVAAACPVLCRRSTETAARGTPVCSRREGASPAVTGCDPAARLPSPLRWALRPGRRGKGVLLFNTVAQTPLLRSHRFFLSKPVVWILQKPTNSCCLIYICSVVATCKSDAVCTTRQV